MASHRNSSKGLCVIVLEVPVSAAAGTSAATRSSDSNGALDPDIQCFKLLSTLAAQRLTVNTDCVPGERVRSRSLPHLQELLSDSNLAAVDSRFSAEYIDDQTQEHRLLVYVAALLRLWLEDVAPFVSFSSKELSRVLDNSCDAWRSIQEAGRASSSLLQCGWPNLPRLHKGAAQCFACRFPKPVSTRPWKRKDACRR